MKKITLLASAVVFCLGYMSESRADTCVSDGKSSNKGTYSESGEECVSCGRNCNWSLNEGTLTISAKDGATNVATNNFNNSSYINPWKDSFSQITSVVVEEGISSIGDNAFYNAGHIESVTFSEGLQRIGEQAFRGNNITGSLSLPDSLSSIGWQAFVTNHITDFNIPTNLTSLNGFAENNITSLEIPSWVTSIGSEAFWNNSISSLYIPSGVSLGWDAFFYQNDKNGKYTLKSVTLEDGAILGNRPFYSNPYIEELIIPDTLTAEQVAKWNANALRTSDGWGAYIKSIKCVGEDGESGDDEKCIAALSRYIFDEDGNCSAGSSYYCIRNAQKIGNTCIGQYFSSVSNDGTCVSKSSCTGGGNFINSDTHQCVTSANCTGMYVIDTINKKCVKMPGCVNFADGACQECDSDYLTNSDGTCTPVADCKNGLHAEDGACVENPEGCNTFADNKCSECNSGLMEQDGGCVASCGAGYRKFDNFCNRVQYTPAEAAAVLTDDNNNSVTITFRK